MELRKAWCRETAHPSYQSKWSEDNPSVGQCCVTALVVQDLYGGDIYSCKVGKNSHFVNIINERIVDKTAEQFETWAKKEFTDHPGDMKLLIVVDKLLTGFDAPSATYLYIDKEMRDHNLFQAICRVNRVYGQDKSNGLIVDYIGIFDDVAKALKLVGISSSRQLMMGLTFLYSVDIIDFEEAMICVKK